MKHFLVKSFTFMLLPLLVVMGVNYFGDAAYLFSEGLEGQVADVMLSGRNVTNVYNFDERKLQRKVIQGLTEAPEVVVLGSSRTLQLNADHFPGKRFRNNSVSSATYQDLGAIWELYAQKDWVPERMIICLDPWLLYPTGGQRRWTSLANEYLDFRSRAALEPVEIPSTSAGKWQQLISPSYFKISLKSILKGGTEVIVTDQKENEELTRISDGSIGYHRSFREASTADINQKITRYLENEASDLLRKDSVDLDVEKVLNFLVETSQAQGTSVEFMMVPYHPRVLDHLHSNDAMFKLETSESWFRAFAKRHGCPIAGSYQAQAQGMDASYFHDGIHVELRGMTQLLQDLDDNKKALQGGNN